jgi:oligopeptide transport system substrate-binding protein
VEQKQPLPVESAYPPGAPGQRAGRRGPLLLVVGIVLAACVLSLACAACGLVAYRVVRSGALAGIEQALGTPVPLPQGRATPVTSPASSGELRLYGAEPVTLDPALVSDSSSSTYVIEIFSGLVTLDENLQVAPDLAERWQVSPDGRTYTFYLRHDAKFQDGRPITSADVQYSFERACSPQLASQPAKVYLSDIEGAAAVMQGRAKEISGLHIIDDYTLSLTIDAPKAYFLAKLTYPTAFVVDRANVSQGANWTDHPNGSGPFRLARRDGQHIVLERNPYFYRGAAKLERVTFTLAGGDPMTMYENDQLDIVDVGLSDIDRVLDPSNPLHSELTVTDSFDVEYLGMNTQVPPFDDPAVRRAFAQAIDRQRLADVVLMKTVTPAVGILPPGFPGYQADLQGVQFDPDAALASLRQSKYKDAADLPEVVLYTSGEGGTMPPTVEAIVDMLSTNLGVQVQVQQTPWSNFLRDLDQHRYGFFLTGWIADYPDPQNFVDILFHSDSVNNYANYRNPQVDQLLAQARVEKDNAKRMQLYAQAEAIILQDAPCIPLWHSRNYTLVKPYVKGVAASAGLRPWLKDVYLARGS